MACAPPRNCGLPLVDPGGPQPARHRLKPTPCGRLAALRCSLTTRPLRVEESPARGPPLLNGHQERCLPRNSNPLHCADPCSAELPKRLPPRPVSPICDKLVNAYGSLTRHPPPREF